MADTKAIKLKVSVITSTHAYEYWLETESGLWLSRNGIVWRQASRKQWVEDWKTVQGATSKPAPSIIVNLVRRFWWVFNDPLAWETHESPGGISGYSGYSSVGVIFVGALGQSGYSGLPAGCNSIGTVTLNTDTVTVRYIDLHALEERIHD